VIRRIEDEYTLSSGVGVRTVMTCEMSMDGDLDPSVFEFEPPD